MMRQYIAPTRLNEKLIFAGAQESRRENHEIASGCLQVRGDADPLERKGHFRRAPDPAPERRLAFAGAGIAPPNSGTGGHGVRWRQLSSVGHSSRRENRCEHILCSTTGG